MKIGPKATLKRKGRITGLIVENEKVRGRIVGPTGQFQRWTCSPMSSYYAASSLSRFQIENCASQTSTENGFPLTKGQPIPIHYLYTMETV